MTPLEPEDVFALSRGIDRLLNHARELVNESEVMACPPDARIAEMAHLLAEALAAHRHGGRVPRLRRRRGDRGRRRARSRLERRLEHAYYAGMAGAARVEDRSERIARRELYRRCSRIGETVVDVAERVVYAVMKES